MMLNKYATVDGAAGELAWEKPTCVIMTEYLDHEK